MYASQARPTARPPQVTNRPLLHRWLTRWLAISVLQVYYGGLGSALPEQVAAWMNLRKQAPLSSASRTDVSRGGAWRGLARGWGCGVGVEQRLARGPRRTSPSSSLVASEAGSASQVSRLTMWRRRGNGVLAAGARLQVMVVLSPMHVSNDSEVATYARLLRLHAAWHREMGVARHLLYLSERVGALLSDPGVQVRVAGWVTHALAALVAWRPHVCAAPRLTPRACLSRGCVGA